jgi:glycosyltransferase involved in cell wall biosynthesis
VIGRIMPDDALMLARAVYHLIEQGCDIELKIVGAEPANREALVRMLGDRLVTTGPVRHDDALRHMLGADVLISSVSRKRARTLALSSKLFEYLSTGRPVIAINPTVPDRQLLRGAEGVQILEQPNDGSTAAAILKALEDGAGPSAAWVKEWGELYDRRTQTGVLAGWLEILVESVAADRMSARHGVPDEMPTGER